jgi:hypothetical protein
LTNGASRAQGPASAPPNERAALRVWLVVFLLLGVTWRGVRYGLGFPLWGDETYLHTSVFLHGFRELAAMPLEYAQVAPLLFMWAQRVVFEWLGGNEFAARLFPLFSGVAALAFFTSLALRTIPLRSAVLAIAIFSASYPLVRHPVEAKPYATDAMVATLLLWLAVRWRENPDRPLWAAATTLASALGVWLSYPAVFVAGGIVLGLLPAVAATRMRRAWLAWLAHAALLAASFAAFYFTYARAASQRAAGTWLEEIWTPAFPPLDSVQAFAWWFLEVHTGPMMGHPVGGTQFGSTGVTILFLIGAAVLVRRRLGGLVWLCLAAALLALVAAAMRRYPYGASDRTMLWFAPTICLFAGAGLSAVIDAIRSVRLRATVAVGAGLLLGGICVIGIVRDLRQPYKTLDDLRVREIVRNMTAQVPIDSPLVSINAAYAGDSVDDPSLSQSIRYYLLLYRGRDLIWAHQQPLPTKNGWVLAFGSERGGPDHARIEALAADAGMTVTERIDYSYSSKPVRRVFLARCEVPHPSLSAGRAAVR